jgi:hypothetical protein
VWEDRSDSLFADGSPGHESFIEEYVAGVDYLAMRRNPNAVAAGHIWVETQVDACNAVRV